MRRDFGAKLIAFAILGLVVAAVYYVILPNLPQSNIELRLGDGVYKASVAYTENDRLADTNLTSVDQAVILAYPVESKISVGTNNIKSATDILWLNKNKKVVYIVKNASNDNSGGKAYEPKVMAKYVIKLSAGSVDSRAISASTTAIFDIDEGKIN